jgi:hypothetical protein
MSDNSLVLTTNRSNSMKPHEADMIEIELNDFSEPK